MKRISVFLGWIIGAFAIVWLVLPKRSSASESLPSNVGAANPTDSFGMTVPNPSPITDYRDPVPSGVPGSPYVPGQTPKSTGTMSNPGPFYVPPGKLPMPRSTTAGYGATMPAPISAPSNTVNTIPPAIAIAPAPAPTNVVRNASQPLYTSPATIAAPPAPSYSQLPATPAPRSELKSPTIKYYPTGKGPRTYAL